MEGGAPKGRRLDGESGMKKSGGDRLKQAIYESTRAAGAVPLPQWGRCPVGADRALAAGKTDEESGTARHIWGKSESLGKDFSLRPKWRYRDLMSPSLIPNT